MISAASQAGEGASSQSCTAFMTPFKRHRFAFCFCKFLALHKRPHSSYASCSLPLRAFESHGTEDARKTHSSGTKWAAYDKKPKMLQLRL